MSTIRVFGLLCFSASLYAQFSVVSGTKVTSEVQPPAYTQPTDYIVEIYDIHTNALIQRVPGHQGHFKFQVPVGWYSIRLLAAPGKTPFFEENRYIGWGGAPLVLLLGERSAGKPVDDLVSVSELKHPLPRKALREVFEAQKSARANDFRKAIAKLEHVIHVYPSYQDAHLSLGAQYARVGRTADARAEFQKALEIGPPAAPIYADLALTSLALGQRQEAVAFAHQALKLDASDRTAQDVLETTSPH